MSSADHATYDLIVLGAGPAGLTAAIAARLDGFRVLVVEKRRQDLLLSDGENAWGSRSRNVVIDEEPLSQLARLGVNHLCITPPRSFRIFDVAQAEGIELRRTKVTRAVTRAVLNRLLGGVTSIRDIELALRRRTQELGIEIRFGHQLTSWHGGTLLLQDTRPGREPVAVSGSLVAIAEGAGSPTFHRLGGGRIPLGFEKTDWIVANFELPDEVSCREIRIGLKPDAEHSYFAMALTHGRSASVYITAMAGFELSRDIESLLNGASRYLALDGRLKDAPTRFTVDVDRASRFHLAENFVAIGDISRKADPGSGFGISSAIYDSVRLTHLLNDLRSGGENGRAEAFRRFEKAMLESADLIARQARYFFKVRKAGQGGWHRKPALRTFAAASRLNNWLFTTPEYLAHA